jgi:hypothetical protein
MMSAIAQPDDLRIPPLPRRLGGRPIAALVREASLVVSLGALLSWGAAEVAGMLLGY